MPVLPDASSNSHDCKTCNYLPLCAILSKIHNKQPFSFDLDGDNDNDIDIDDIDIDIDNGNGNDGIGEGREKERKGVSLCPTEASTNYVIDLHAQHLSESSVNYFKHWVR